MLIFVFAVLLVLLLAQWRVQRRGFEGIGYSTRPSKTTVEPEEPFDIITRLENGTRRFVPFIGMQEHIPADLELITPGLETRAVGRGLVYLISSAFLRPRQLLERRVTASLPRRGRYFLRGATLSIGDFFGLSEQSEMFSLFSEIVVVPRPFEHPDLSQTLGGFLGDVSVNRFIMEDPVLTLGFREYTMREPMKMISWTQTARTGQMMVKNYDHTLELTVSVLLNIQCGPEAPARAQLIEACFSLSRSVCATLEGKGIQYDFITNASAAGALSLWGTVGEGLGDRHFMTILEGLGRATHSATEPFEAILTLLARRAQQGRCYIVITPQPIAQEARALSRLRELTGGQVLVIAASQLMTLEGGYAPSA